LKILKNNVGNFVTIHYDSKIYLLCEIAYEHGNIYLMNNYYKNNNGHKDKSKYKYSILIEDQKWIDVHAENINFINKHYELW